MHRRLPWPPEYRTYRVRRKDREPLVRFMVEALECQGCRVIFASDPGEAPFRITFEAPHGERLGIVAYAFLANRKNTRNRPKDEHRFQIKYSTAAKGHHEVWQDPLGLYTTLLVGINPDDGYFVSADPVLNSPTRFFKSVEFKNTQVEQIMAQGWSAWERARRIDADEPVEVLVGGTPDNFLRLIYFEREALGEDQGHRQWLAERFAGRPLPAHDPAHPSAQPPLVSATRAQNLAEELDLTADEVLDLISRTPRMKMAVRGGVAELHLHRRLSEVPGVSACRRLGGDHETDVELWYHGSGPVRIECKNALRRPDAENRPRLDFQRTRASREDPCSRYYSPDDFDLVAACLHAVTDRWEFRYHPTGTLPAHRKCEGRLDNNLRIDDNWTEDVRNALEAVARSH